MTPPAIVLTAAIGLAAGLIARLIMPGKDSGGLVVTTLLGIGGSLLASFAVRYFGITIPGGPLLAAVAGALLILVAYRIIIRL